MTSTRKPTAFVDGVYRVRFRVRDIAVDRGFSRIAAYQHLLHGLSVLDSNALLGFLDLRFIQLWRLGKARTHP